MGSYRLSSSSAVKLEKYKYKDEDSLQKMLAENPDVIMSLPGLELSDSEICLVYREYKTTSGPIDLLIINENAEIVIIETKLIKNPEFVRTVVAQAIDYVKAFSAETVEGLVDKMARRPAIKDTLSEKVKTDERFIALLTQNIEKGNFRVMILGDAINRNILGMVESIQSAPHLAFTIYLVELNTAVCDGGEIIVTPKIVGNTLEVERSVIKIEIAREGDAHKIESEAPTKGSKGSKPVLSWDQYIASVTNKGFAKVIEDFKATWVNEIDNSISMGGVGFSAGIEDGGKRTAIQFVYGGKVAVISERAKGQCNIPDDYYQEYKEDIKKTPGVYDKYLVGNKVEVAFEEIDAAALKIILDASLNLARKLKEVSQNN